MKKLLWILLVAVGLLLPAAQGLAQEETAAIEPASSPPPLPAERYYAAYALGLVLVGGVLIGAFKSGHRTHLD